MLTPVGLAVADEDDPLAPEPANLAGALIGYARVSTSGQNLDRQARAWTKASCIRQRLVHDRNPVPRRRSPATKAIRSCRDRDSRSRLGTTRVSPTRR